MSNFKEFKELCERSDVYGPLGTDSIEAAERVLNIKFPNQFRQFLLDYGALVGEGVEIYGLPEIKENSPPLWQNIILVSNTLRNNKQFGTERSGFFPISEDGFGNYFFIDSSRDKENCEIWAIGPDIDRLVARDFYKFALDLHRGKYSSIS